MTHIAHTIPNPSVWPLISHDEIWTASGVAPHTLTTRISLVALGGMASLIHAIHMRRSVATVPTTYGESGIVVLVDGVQRVAISTSLSAATPYHNLAEYRIMYIPPGASLDIQSFDFSTGGSLFWRVFCQILNPYP